jgi:hypothetical protein
VLRVSPSMKMEAARLLRKFCACSKLHGVTTRKTHLHIGKFRSRQISLDLLVEVGFSVILCLVQFSTRFIYVTVCFISFHRSCL